MEAEQLFKAGKLAQAIEAQLAKVKQQPANASARFFLAELAAIAGDWDRTDRQLETIIKQSSDPDLYPLLLRQLVRAEIQREQVFTEGRPPEVVVAMDTSSELQLKICTAIRLGSWNDLADLLEKEEAARPKVSGRCGDTPFDTILDMDDRLRGMAEVLTGHGKYYWVPWNRVQSIVFNKPQRATDLIWRRATISVAGGPDGEVYLPARYPNPGQWTDLERMGRETRWEEPTQGVFTGIGQRTLLIGDEERSFLELEEISIEIPPT
jgi:type VI secretion system protein ImpE